MEHLAVYAILFGWGAVFAFAALIASLILSTIVCLTLSRAVPRLSERAVLLLSTSIIPVAMLGLMAASILHVFSEDFRGPEVLGIIILGIGLLVMWMVGWPLSYFAIRRFLVKV